MKIIAVANRKGGTGKTTSAVNLAADWASKGYNVLLIDLDTQGHSAIGIGCGEHEKHWPTVHTLFKNPAMDLNELIMPTPIENFSLLAADTSFDGLGVEWDTTLLRDKINVPEIQNEYQRIVIDTPPTLDALLISAMVAAHGVLVPFVPHHLAEVGVRQLAKLFYRVATQHNTNLKLLGLLPIMVDKRIRLHQQVVVTLKKQFGDKRVLRGIRNNIKLAEAFSVGKPIVQYAPKSAGAMDYNLLSDELESFWF